ncbi:MAG: ABC-type uncharacterized transport system [Paenibacillus sp.]|nr:ABC-type uncharacterized transport system [Paenibacillus sp.]
MNKWIRGTNATVISIAVIAIFVIATLFLNTLKGFQLDLSADKKYSLSDQTITVLNKLDKDIKITLFTGSSSTDEDLMYREVSDLLTEYKKRSSRITFEESDPNRDPTKAKDYEIDQPGTIVFELGDKRKKVQSYELFAPGQSEGSYGFMGESKFTQSILSLTSPVKIPIYFLTGHNEIQPMQIASFRSTLEGENYELKELNLLRDAKIPDDATSVFILGPQKDFDPKEVDLLKQYVQGNGKLFISTGYFKDMQNMKNFDELLAAVNVKNVNAVAIETARTVYNSPLTIVPSIEVHTITQAMTENGLAVVLPISVAYSTDSTNANWKARPLLKSSASAYGETNISQLTGGSGPKQDEGDLKGPLDLAYAVMDKDNKPKAIVLGSNEMLFDQYISLYGNRDFALNSVNWMQEQTDQVTIRARQQDAMQTAIIMPNKAKMIFYGTVVIYPLAILALGGLIWWRRRKG